MTTKIRGPIAFVVVRVETGAGGETEVHGVHNREASALQMASNVVHLRRAEIARLNPGHRFVIVPSGDRGFVVLQYLLAEGSNVARQTQRVCEVRIDAVAMVITPREVASC